MTSTSEYLSVAFIKAYTVLYWWGYLSDVQFDDIGHHGTKILIYNLWLNDDDVMELDFNSDPEVLFIPLLHFILTFEAQWIICLHNRIVAGYLY